MCVTTWRPSALPSARVHSVLPLPGGPVTKVARPVWTAMAMTSCPRLIVSPLPFALREFEVRGFHPPAGANAANQVACPVVSFPRGLPLDEDRFLTQCGGFHLSHDPHMPGRGDYGGERFVPQTPHEIPHGKYS